MRLFHALKQTKTILSAIVGETNVSNGKSVLKFKYCERVANFYKILYFFTACDLLFFMLFHPIALHGAGPLEGTT